MRSYTSQVLLLAIFAVLPVAHAQEEGLAGNSGIAVPVKGTITATGSVELLIRIYDRPKWGHELYSATATLPVENHMYFDMIDVPDTVFRGRQTVYVEVATTATPESPLEARAQFTKPGGVLNKSFTILGCSLCYTCGGSYPVFSGAFGTVGIGTRERGRSCSGKLESTLDFQPNLCCQTGKL